MSGRLHGNTKKVLCQIVEKYQLNVRLTPNQDILLCNIGHYQKSSINEELKEIGITKPDSPDLLERHALACPALPLCGLAITEAERILPSILERIKVQLQGLEIKDLE